jgi:hypothetical protein
MGHIRSSGTELFRRRAEDKAVLRNNDKGWALWGPSFFEGVYNEESITREDIRVWYI